MLLVFKQYSYSSISSITTKFSLIFKSLYFSVSITTVVILDLSTPKISTPYKPPDRSEVHTSELQSRFDLLCRHLLVKKKGIAVRLVSQSRDYLAQFLFSL